MLYGTLHVMIKFKNKIFLFLEVVILILLYIWPIAIYFRGVGDYIFLSDFNKRDGSLYWALLIGGIGSFSIFFIHAFYLIPCVLAKKRVIKYVLFLVILFTGLTLMEYGIKEWLRLIYHLPENFNQLYPKEITFRRDMSSLIWLTNLIILTLSFLYRFTRDWKKNEIDKKKLLQEKTNAELQFLRSQINPQFLFNTLNDISIISQRNKDNETSEAIEKLTTLMQFMLYDSKAKVIPLEKEIGYIHSLIEIQQLRVKKDELIVNVSEKGTVKDVLISPILLIPFIENAFKHGINFNEISVIEIKIEVTHKILKFQVKNKISKMCHSVLKESSGIGLENVKKRLNLIYPKKHTLNIFKDNSNFKVLLTIDLT